MSLEARSSRTITRNLIGKTDSLTNWTKIGFCRFFNTVATLTDVAGSADTHGFSAVCTFAAVGVFADVGGSPISQINVGIRKIL